jgi:hypothetical protein
LATSAPSAVTVSIVDLVDGSSMSGALVAHPGGQVGVFSDWPRDFIWNRPAAGRMDGADPDERWLPLKSVEVARTHARPEAGLALVVFRGDFAIDVPTLEPRPEPHDTRALLADNDHNWSRAFEAVYPGIARLAQSAPVQSTPPQLDPAEYPPADFVERLSGGGADRSWRICELLRLC